MEFNDLKQQYDNAKLSIDIAIQRVLSHGKYIMGEEVYQLENQLAEYTGSRYVISCSNGTDALRMALMVWGIGPGDCVFTTAFSFIATAEVIALQGATPVFVDIDVSTFNINPDKLEEAIQKALSEGKNPKAIVTVDLFGLAADYERIRAIADQYGLLVLEDGAQGFSGSFKSQKNCTFGDISTTSFFPTKPLGCYGDGGAIFTNNDNWADLLRSLRVHGKGKNKYDNVRLGLKCRLDTIQAAILLEKLKLVDMETERKNKVAVAYTAGLNNIVKTPSIPEGYVSAWAQYSILLTNKDQRNKLQAYLKEKNIPSIIYYPCPMPLQGAYRYLGYTESDFPVTQDVCNRVLSLPMHAYLNNDQIDRVVQAMQSFFS